MKQLFIVCRTWKDTDMTIETFYSKAKCNALLTGLLGDELGEKAGPDDEPQNYLDKYSAWEDENEPNWHVKLKIVEL